MKMKKTVALVLSTVMVSGVFAGGVSAQEQTAEQVQELKTMGEKKEGSYEVKLKNATGKDIRTVCVSVDQGEFGTSLLPATDVWQDQKEMILYVTPEKKEGADPAQGDTSEYDIRLSFIDNNVVTLHRFPFGYADSAEICLEGDTAYLKYTSKSLQTEQNTLEAEKAAADPTAQTAAAADSSASAGTAAQTAAAADSSASAGTAAQTSGTDSSYTEPSYDSGSYDYSYDSGEDYSYYEEPSYDYSDYSDSGSDGGDACLDDGLTLN